METEKITGAIGAILIAVGFSNPILMLAGIVMILVSLRRLADIFKEERIFRDALIGLVTGGVGLGVAFVCFLVIVLSLVFSSIVTYGTAEAPITVYSPLRQLSAFLLGPRPFQILLAFVVPLLIVFISLLVEGIFLREAFRLLSAKSGEKLFDTAGTVLLIGSLLTILLVGFIILPIGWIILAIAFFSLRARAQQSPSQVSQAK